MKRALTFNLHHLLNRCPFALILALSLFASVNAQQKRGSITGQVVTDDGAPMSGVSVRLFAAPAGSGGSSPQIVVTDADGNFQFTNLPTRTYSVAVMESGAYSPPQRPANTPATLYRPGDQIALRMIRGGVITGRVIYANGDPMIGVSVTAIRVRDAEGRPVQLAGPSRTRLTDDRGIYRLYGLTPGTYLVANNYGGSMFANTQLPFDGDAPTYHPSATRDTAVEVQVAGSAEISGIDIRHRGDRGHIVSGKVIGGSDSSTEMVSYLSSVMLLSSPSGILAGSTSTRAGEGENGFSFLGVPDGEYELQANRGSADGESSSFTEPRRVTVRGSDVTGLELRLLPMGSIAGRVTLETAPTPCPKDKSTIQEVLLWSRREEQPTDMLSSLRSFPAFFSVNEKGEFKITALPPGRFHLSPNLPTENWFVKSIAGSGTGTGAPGKSAANDLARSGVALKSGEKLSGVAITIAEGAASLRGKVAAKAGAKLPSRLRVHLVPAEPAATDEVLRYAETLIGDDGAFTFTNLAPGKYRLLVRAVPDDEPANRLPVPAAWDTAGRARLRKDADKNEIELKACQHLKDYVLTK